MEIRLCVIENGKIVVSMRPELLANYIDRFHVKSGKEILQRLKNDIKLQILNK